MKFMPFITEFEWFEKFEIIKYPKQPFDQD